MPEDTQPAERQPVPPYTRETAARKVQAAEDAWNTRNPALVAKAYTADSQWRNRSDFFQGTEAITSFLTRKWEKEHDYRLRKTLWAFDEDKIAVRFEYEFHDASGQWHRAHGNENWRFDERGYMKERWASINDTPIAESERKFRWSRD